MRLELIVTEDGSHTLYNKDLGDYYHSTYGAIQESLHVYIKSGLKMIEEDLDTINILEIGMGTGLNVFLTYLDAYKTNKKIHYTTLETSPLEISLAEQLNYVNLLNANEHDQVFRKIHELPWNEESSLGNNFTLNKMKESLVNVNLPGKFNLVFYDAFAPDIQPELWGSDVFRKVYDCMLESSILVTYCAKGSVKRSMKNIGFKIEIIQGALGKREMIRAWKSFSVPSNSL
ncbi:tRNA (5-methylaminomethyl-2-thiouridine)(34)-methyltransferase MnmD [Candidatus Amoebophilus asiaticus]|nr:tRNA (5-methylaminomethyl-2-thiouridine)(34)-methyltransferase MnmD [Candidatus Amoebophilus asiaticus]